MAATSIEWVPRGRKFGCQREFASNLLVVLTIGAKTHCQYPEHATVLSSGNRPVAATLTLYFPTIPSFSLFLRTLFSVPSSGSLWKIVALP